MIPELLSCPYCNARFSRPAGESEGPRVRCPRCGDSFPYQSGGEVAADNGQPAPLSPNPPAATARWSNRQVAYVILGIMLGMALIGLGYALYTQPFRRANDTRIPPSAVPAVTNPGSADKPGEGADLGYLPADSIMVARVDLAAILREPEGGQLWTKLRDGPIGMMFTLLENQTGLHVQEIDHLALGLSAGEGPRRRLFVVLHTRRPYSAEALARAMASIKPERYGGRLVYRFSLAGLGDGLLFRLSENTLVLSLGWLPAPLDVLDAIPSKARSGPEAVPAAVRDLVQNKLEHGSLAWAVGQSQANAFAEFSSAFLNLKAFAVGICFEAGQVTLRADLQAADEAAGQKLALQLKQRPPQGVTSFKVLGPEAGVRDKNSKAWVLVQVRASAVGTADLLERLTAFGPLQDRP
jgi:hypothetical protein